MPVDLSRAALLAANLTTEDCDHRFVDDSADDSSCSDSSSGESSDGSGACLRPVCQTFLPCFVVTLHLILSRMFTCAYSQMRRELRPPSPIIGDSDWLLLSSSPPCFHMVTSLGHKVQGVNPTLIFVGLIMFVACMPGISSSGTGLTVLDFMISETCSSMLSWGAILQPSLGVNRPILEAVIPSALR